MIARRRQRASDAGEAEGQRALHGRALGIAAHAVRNQAGRIVYESRKNGKGPAYMFPRPIFERRNEKMRSQKLRIESRLAWS